jgi:hypothetical protein
MFNPLDRFPCATPRVHNDPTTGLSDPTRVRGKGLPDLTRIGICGWLAALLSALCAHLLFMNSQLESTTPAKTMIAPRRD